MDNEFNFPSNITDQLISKYGNYLLSKIDDAQFLQVLDVLINGEKPARKQCHKNATCFSEENKSFQPVHGWLIIDPRPTFQSVKFIAQSVVKSAYGKLIDVTPSDVSDQYLFLPALVEDKDFEDLVDWLNHKHMDGSFNHQIV